MSVFVASTVSHLNHKGRDWFVINYVEDHVCLLIQILTDALEAPRN